MRVRSSVEQATRRWTVSWIGLALALGLHVADEAANDFLAYWNPLVESLRDRAPALPLPTFGFELWLGGLTGAILVLLLLARFVRRGADWMRPVSYVLAVIMLGNGLLHIVGTVLQGRAVPGVYSAPVLLLAAGALLATARRHRRVSGVARSAA
jgi:hypothetical protein